MAGGSGAAGGFAAVLALSRVVSLSSMLAALTAIALVCGLDHPLPYRLLVIAGGLYVLHRANIQRLLAASASLPAAMTQRLRIFQMPLRSTRVRSAT